MGLTSRLHVKKPRREFFSDFQKITPRVAMV
jgi:hypothetical protein